MKILPIASLLLLAPSVFAAKSSRPTKPVSLRFSGTLSSPELPAPLTFHGEWSAVGRGFVAVGTEGNELVTGFDGVRPWTRRPDGLVRVAPPIDRPRLAGELFRMLPGYPFTPGLSAAEVGRDGIFRKFRLPAGAIGEVELGADGQAARSRAPGTEITWEEPAKVGPVRYCRVSRTVAGRRTSEARIEKVEVVTVPAEVGAVPSRGVVFVNGTSGEIPFDGAATLPILAAELETTSGARSVRLIVDLASPVSTLDASVFPGMNAPASPAVVRKIRFPSLEIRDASFRLADPDVLAGIAERTGREVDGTLGADLLLRASLAIDLEKRKIRLVDPDGEAIQSRKDYEAPLRERNGVPLVPAAAGRIGFDLAIDTTSPAGLVLPTSEATRFGIVGAVPVSTERGREAATRLAAFFLGDSQLPAIVRIGTPRAGAPIDLPTSGLGSLAGGYLVLEPERGLLRWRRREDEPAIPLARAGFDIAMRGGKLVVTAVVEDSPAAKLGVAPGDFVEKLGDAKSPTLAGARTFLGLAAGTKIRLTMRHGADSKEIELMLGDLLPYGEAGRMPAAPAK